MNELKVLSDYKCIFCGEPFKDKGGKIQFDEDGNIIGCCETCLDLATVFVKEGRNIKPVKENENGKSTRDTKTPE